MRRCAGAVWLVVGASVTAVSMGKTGRVIKHRAVSQAEGEARTELPVLHCPLRRCGDGLGHAFGAETDDALQEASVARLSERLTVAEETAAVAQANALDAAAALSAVQAAADTNATGGAALRGAVDGLDSRLHELQALVDAAREQAAQAADAASRALATAGRAPDEQARPADCSVFHCVDH